MDNQKNLHKEIMPLCEKFLLLHLAEKVALSTILDPSEESMIIFQDDGLEKCSTENLDIAVKENR